MDRLVVEAVPYRRHPYQLLEEVHLVLQVLVLVLFLFLIFILALVVSESLILNLKHRLLARYLEKIEKISKK